MKHNENTLNINEHNEKTWQTHWKIMQHIETKHWNNTFNIMFDSVQQTSWTIKIRIHWLILSLSPIWAPFEAHLRLVWVSIEVVAGCSSVFVHKFDFELILREFTGFTENHWKQQKITSRPVWVSLRKFYVSPNSSPRSFRVRFDMFPGQKSANSYLKIYWNHSWSHRVQTEPGLKLYRAVFEAPLRLN